MNSEQTNILLHFHYKYGMTVVQRDSQSVNNKKKIRIIVLFEDKSVFSNYDPS